MSDAKDPESTADLLGRVRSGDEAALDELLRRFLPPLRRWAHRQLPLHLRDAADTDDLVQITLLQSLKKVKEFEPQRPGAFLAYLRTVLKSRMIDEIRRKKRRLPHEADGSAIEETVAEPPGISHETMIAYHQALERLTEDERTAVVLRLEMGFTYEEVAAALGVPTANAARMRVSRALVRLSETMDGN